jgi:FMN reductase
VELRDHARDVANHLLTGFPSPALRQVIDEVVAANGLIAVTPIFKASYSGLFKAFFDVLDDTSLAGTPVLIAATGGTARHSLALEHAVRPLFAYMRSVVMPTAVYAAPEDWSGDTARAGATGALNERIHRASAELADEVARGQSKPATDPFALGSTFEDLLRGE